MINLEAPACLPGGRSLGAAIVSSNPQRPIDSMSLARSDFVFSSISARIATASLVSVVGVGVAGVSEGVLEGSMIRV